MGGGGGGPTHYRPYLRVYFSFRLVVLKGRLTFHYDPELDNFAKSLTDKATNLTIRA